MCFTHHTLTDTVNSHIQIGNEVIDVVPVYKYLGKQLDCELTFNCEYNESIN